MAKKSVEATAFKTNRRYKNLNKQKKTFCYLYVHWVNKPSLFFVVNFRPFNSDLCSHTIQLFQQGSKFYSVFNLLELELLFLSIVLKIVHNTDTHVHNRHIRLMFRSKIRDSKWLRTTFC